jgi:P2-related tail formation protein
MALVLSLECLFAKHGANAACLPYLAWNFQDRGWTLCEMGRSL